MEMSSVKSALDLQFLQSYINGMSYVSEAVRIARNELGMSRSELARMLGVTRVFMRDVEIGARKLPEERYSLLPEPIRRAVREARIRETEELLAALRREL